MHASTMGARTLAPWSLKRMTSVVCALALATWLLALSAGTSLGQSDAPTQVALTALSSNDWPTLYGMLEDGVQRTQSEQDFTAKMANFPAFFDAVLDGESEKLPLFDNVSAIPVKLSAHAADGSILTYHTHLTISHEGRLQSWRLPVLVKPLDEAMLRAVAAISASDWGTFYDMLFDEAHTQISKQEYLDAVASHGYTRFFNATIAGPAIESHVLGSTVYSVPIALDGHEPDGSVKHYRSTLKFEDGYILSLAPPELA